MQASRAEPKNEHPYDHLQLFTIQSSPSEDPAGNQIYHENDERRRQQSTENIAVSRHMLSAVIAFLALSFVTVVATLILTIRMMPTGASETKGMAEVKQQLIELRHEIKASKVNQTGGEGRVFDKAKRNCAELYKAGQTISGVYTIDPDGKGAFNVFCDQETTGGGWTVFQKRLDGSVSFDRYWDDYKIGFGNLNGEFWLGLDKIYRLKEKKHNCLRVDLKDFTPSTAYAEYDMFAVTNETTKYKLSLGKFSGTAGDSLLVHRGYPFSTRDRDHDTAKANCASYFQGAWWYTNCHDSNLNGLYYNGSHPHKGQGIIWNTWKGIQYSLKTAEMKIRPTDF